MKRTNLLWMAAGVLLVLSLFFIVPRITQPTCPGSLVWCPGVGCVSGPDKCIPGSRGGATRVFSKETFTMWPGAGVPSIPPTYKESFVSKQCPDGTRSDGPCLLEF